MATHIPYHRWILTTKSIRPLSAKLRRRNQLTSDRRLYSQTPVIPQRALQTPASKNRPRSLLWLGRGDGIRISPAAPSPKTGAEVSAQMCEDMGHPRCKVCKGREKPSACRSSAPAPFSRLLFSSTTLQNRGAHRHRALL